MPTPVESLLSRVLQAERFSNRITNAVVRGYAIRVGRAAERVRLIEEGTVTLAGETDLLRRALRNWGDTSLATLRREILDFARVESRFVGHQLDRIREAEIEKPVHRSVQTVRFTPDWAEAVVNSRPSAATPKPRKGSHTVGRREGKAVSHPDGSIPAQQFRRIGEDSVATYNRVVRSGLLQGRSSSQIARDLSGRINYNRPAVTQRELAQAEGALWRAAPRQIKTEVRTAINQVQNQVNAAVIAANADDFPYYFYVAVLDTRTTAICGSLDGQRFEHGEGPLPPQHFNCRSTTIPAMEGQDSPLPSQRAYRDENGKTRLTMQTSYGNWLSNQSNRVQDAALGASRGELFRRAVSDGNDPGSTISQFLRRDGSEASLAELRRLDIFDSDED